MQRARAGTLFLALALLAGLTTACGGDTTAPEPTATEHADEASSFNEDLRARAERLASATFTAKYVLRATVDGTTIDGRLTWYQAPGKVRGDFDGLVDGQGTTVIVIPGPGYPEERFLYICPGGEGGGVCREWRSASEQEDYPRETLPMMLAWGLLDIHWFAATLALGERSERSVLGQELVCFLGRAEAGAALDHGELCVTADGVPLLVTEAGQDLTVSLVATEFAPTVGGDAFELPFPLEAH